MKVCTTGCASAFVNATIASSNDTLIADNGTDTLLSSGTGNTLIGGSGADVLATSGSDDTLIAGSGANTLFSDGDGNTLNGTAGIGTVAAYAINDLVVNLATDTASVNGSSTADTLIGITAAAAMGFGDTLIGGSGSSTLFSNGAGNTLIAGTGQTTAAFDAGDLTANLSTGAAVINGLSTGDTFTGFSAAAVVGTADTLIAGSGVETLIGGGLDDTLFGNASGSTLDGSSGSGTVAAYTTDNVTINLSAYAR